jgi:hypothetical protein
MAYRVPGPLHQATTERDRRHQGLKPSGRAEPPDSRRSASHPPPGIARTAVLSAHVGRRRSLCRLRTVDSGRAGWRVIERSVLERQRGAFLLWVAVCPQGPEPPSTEEVMPLPGEPHGLRIAEPLAQDRAGGSRAVCIHLGKLAIVPTSTGAGSSLRRRDLSGRRIVDTELGGGVPPAAAFAGLTCSKKSENRSPSIGLGGMAWQSTPSSWLFT